MRKAIRAILARIRGEATIATLKKRGMKVGNNFLCMNGVWIDPGHCWLISFGDNVTLAPRVTVLAHDASPQAFLRVTKIGNVTVGNNVFIGAGSIILPGVTIGDNVVIGAGAVVCKDIPNDTVAAGNPAKPVMTIAEYIARVADISTEYDVSYLYPAITPEKQIEMRRHLLSNRFARLVPKNDTRT